MSMRGLLSGLGQGLAQVGGQWNKQAASATAQEKLRAFQKQQSDIAHQRAVESREDSQAHAAQQGVLGRADASARQQAGFEHAETMQANSQAFAGQQAADGRTHAEKMQASSQAHQTNTANPTVITTVSDEGKRQQVYQAGEVIDTQTLSAEAMASNGKKQDKPAWDDKEVTTVTSSLVDRHYGLDGDLTDITDGVREEAQAVKAEAEKIGKDAMKASAGGEVNVNQIVQQAVANVRLKKESKQRVAAAMELIGASASKISPAKLGLELFKQNIPAPEAIDAMADKKLIDKTDQAAMAKLFRDWGFSPEEGKQALAQMGFK